MLSSCIVLGSRILVPPRKNARKVVAKGLFPNAIVVRGHDWKWEDQDGTYVCI